MMLEKLLLRIDTDVGALCGTMDDSEPTVGGNDAIKMLPNVVVDATFVTFIFSSVLIK